MTDALQVLLLPNLPVHYISVILVAFLCSGIIKGGENIAPREIDETLLEHDCVLEAAAFAVPCENYGQRVEACIRLKPGMHAAADSLIQHCKDRLGKFKSPDNIHILDDLPKGPSGKVQRLKLHNLVYDRS